MFAGSFGTIILQEHLHNAFKLSCCSVIVLRISAPTKLNNNLFTLVEHVVLSSFQFSAGFVSLHISLYQFHESMNSAQLLSVEPCSTVGLSGFFETDL